MVPLVLALAGCGSPSSTAPTEPHKGGIGPPQTRACRSAAVVLNELSPANVSALADMEGESVDWIELYNGGREAVDLAGWALSDGSGDPREWVFPSLVLEPGAFLLVHASGKDRARLV